MIWLDALMRHSYIAFLEGHGKNQHASILSERLFSAILELYSIALCLAGLGEGGEQQAIYSESVILNDIKFTTPQTGLSI